MVYHSIRIPASARLTPMQKFDHIVRVRNRALGELALKPSPELAIEISETNSELLSMDINDISMHKMLQNSTCKTNKKRFVAKRTLDALGRLSGLSNVLNGKKGLVEIRSGLEFASRSVSPPYKMHNQCPAVLTTNHCM